MGPAECISQYNAHAAVKSVKMKISTKKKVPGRAMGGRPKGLPRVGGGGGVAADGQHKGKPNSVTKIG